jgi:hypothetical protein
MALLSNEQLDAASPEELAELTGTLLERFEPGWLPLPVFSGVLRLAVASTVEVVALRTEDPEDPEVLMTQRPENDMWWASQWHVPGSLLLPNDEVRDVHDFSAPIARVFDSELEGRIEALGKPSLFDLQRRSGPRGKELTPFFWTEVALVPGASEPANSRFFKASEIAGGLPDLQFIKGHLDVASRAIDACRDPRQAIENLVRLLH